MWAEETWSYNMAGYKATVWAVFAIMNTMSLDTCKHKCLCFVSLWCEGSRGLGQLVWWPVCGKGCPICLTCGRTNDITHLCTTEGPPCLPSSAWLQSLFILRSFPWSLILIHIFHFNSNLGISKWILWKNLFTSLLVSIFSLHQQTVLLSHVLFLSTLFMLHHPSLESYN